jgi:DNA-binding MarR family transcriptional regulator
MTEIGDPPISELLIDLLDAVLYFDKKQIVQAGRVRLHPSETHMLMCALEGMSFTQMAQRFGISKGAVSQTFSRLAAKGVIASDNGRAYKSATRVTLTPLGQELHARIKALRARLSEDLDQYLAEYSQAELAVISRFVVSLRTYFAQSLATLPAPEGQSR